MEQIPDYHLDDNAVCDGSSCGLQRPITDGVRGAARKHGTARRVLDSTGATHVPLWKELGMQPSTHFTPPPFTIILGLHHKCVNVERELGLRVSEGCGLPEGAGEKS